MRRWRRWTIAAALGLGITAGRPRPAQADSDGAIFALVTVAAGLAIADVTYATYDIVVAAKGELPSRGWAITETVFITPEAVLLNGLMCTVGVKEDLDGFTSVFAVPLVGISALGTHGIWATASTTVDPRALAGVSTAIGANTAFTAYDVSRAINRKLGSRNMGIAEVLMTVPQTVVGSVQIASGTADRPAWIGLTAWSGALVLHGLFSAVLGEHTSDPPPPPLPPPPPPPPPGDREKPPLMVPASIHFVPTLVTDGIARAPGVGIVGVF